MACIQPSVWIHVKLARRHFLEDISRQCEQIFGMLYDYILWYALENSILTKCLVPLKVFGWSFRRNVCVSVRVCAVYSTQNTDLSFLFRMLRLTYNTLLLRFFSQEHKRLGYALFGYMTNSIRNRSSNSESGNGSSVINTTTLTMACRKIEQWKLPKIII